MVRLTAFTALITVLSVIGCASTQSMEQTAKASSARSFEITQAEDAVDLNISVPALHKTSCNKENLCDYSLLCLADESAQELVKAGTGPYTHPAIHGPYSISLLLDFIAPSKDKLDEAYGVDTRFVIRAFENVYLGGTIGYARMKHEEREGLIKGEIQRYTALFWCEYRYRLGDTTWSPSVDVAIGPGWFFGKPVPLAERRQTIESTGNKLKVMMISNPVIRLSAQLRIPVHRSTDMSISEGNADIIIGIGSEFGEGRARYTIADYTTLTKTVSKGALALDALHLFIGLSFRF